MKNLLIDQPQIMSVPQRLEVPGRPELNNFPLNILFTTMIKGKKETKVYDVLYLPDFSTFKESKKKSKI